MLIKDKNFKLENGMMIVFLDNGQNEPSEIVIEHQGHCVEVFTPYQENELITSPINKRTISIKEQKR